MPFKDVKDEMHTWERRLVLLSVLTLIISLIASGTAVVISRRESTHATQIAKANRSLISQDRRLRRQRADLIENNTIQNCYARHLIAGSVINTIQQSIAQTEILLKQGALNSLGPKILNAERESIANMRQLIANLRLADCDINNPQDIVPATKTK